MSVLHTISVQSLELIVKRKELEWQKGECFQKQ